MGQSKPPYAQLLTFCEIGIAERRRESVRRAHEKTPHKLAYTSVAGMPKHTQTREMPAIRLPLSVFS